MKFRKKVISLALALITIVNLSIIGSMSAFAHETVLNVEYDICIDDDSGDGIDEMWYSLTPDNNKQIHFNHNSITITYGFAGTAQDWTPAGQTEEVGEEIKAAYANSMKKWNNVYFYSYNPNGTITKNRLIQIVEATSYPPNIIISPETASTMGGTIAATTTYEGFGGVEIVSEDHEHYSYWLMWVNIDFFCEETNFTSINNITNADISLIKENTGAHELGHVLGLFDLDDENLCNADDSDWHHHEILMGYGSPINMRSANITYKDIAGVAITRGFHTDNDHKWLNMGQQSDGTYKLVCSICNGVQYVENLNGYSYETYGDCGNHHTLSSGNMMAVASYLSRDYYKCKYCRYVAPFANRVSQNYKRCYYSEEYHKCVNDVNGLKYVIYEPHTFVNGECTECGPHIYSTCVYIDAQSHQTYCACGAEGVIGQHYIVGGVSSGTRFAPCGGCGYLMPILGDGQIGIMSATQVSINGSYILPNGIVVLVEEDVEAYLAGTLQFYHPEDVPVTQ